jgi:hypothetical protein
MKEAAEEKVKKVKKVKAANITEALQTVLGPELIDSQGNAVIAQGRTYTNAQFARDNEAFKKACDTAFGPQNTANVTKHTQPSKRQASKYLRGMGLAYKKLKTSELD